MQVGVRGVRGCKVLTSENARGAAGRAGEGASGPEKETRRSELLDDRGLLELATPSLLELVVRIAAASSSVRPSSRPRPSSMRARAWLGLG